MIRELPGFLTRRSCITANNSLKELLKYVLEIDYETICGEIP